MADNIPFIKPKFPDAAELIEDINRITQNNYYSNNGPVYHEFKQKIEDYIGQDVKAVVVANATLALMIAIRAIFSVSSASDKKLIAIPSFTFSAGPLAIKWCGFEPLFIDINLHDAQPSLESMHDALDKYGTDLAGVLLPNSFGIGNERIDEWQDLLTARSLPLIIDSAPGFGSMYSDDSFLGARGTCEVFSFHATKPFGIGEGGLITTKDAELAAELESLKNFGFNEKKETVSFGINAKITELDCAIGLRILAKYDEILSDRRSTYGKFKAKLSGTEISFLPRTESSAIQFATILSSARSRDPLLAALKAGGIDARTYYAPPVHTFPFFAGASCMSLPATAAISDRVISLPVHPDMNDETINYICGLISRTLQEI